MYNPNKDNMAGPSSANSTFAGLDAYDRRGANPNNSASFANNASLRSDRGDEAELADSGVGVERFLVPRTQSVTAALSVFARRCSLIY